MLRVDPAQLPRLETIEVNVRGRLAEAPEMNWRGEVAGLEVSLRHVINKEATPREHRGSFACQRPATLTITPSREVVQRKCQSAL
jgi:hypothetical protein